MSTPTAAERLAVEISKLARSPLIAASGYGGLLKLLVDYMADQQRRISQLELDVQRHQKAINAIAPAVQALEHRR